jgi:Arc/MetJ-type ribon-helix-helix transcriptional regulator
LYYDFNMALELSPQSEQFLAQIVAGGEFSSKEDALEAAVVALREKLAPLPMIPEEHMDAVEQAIVSANQGRCRPLTPADWEGLRELAKEVAASKAAERCP